MHHGAASSRQTDGVKSQPSVLKAHSGCIKVPATINNCPDIYPAVGAGERRPGKAESFEDGNRLVVGLAADQRGKICRAATPQAIGSGQNRGQGAQPNGGPGTSDPRARRLIANILSHEAPCTKSSLAGKSLGIAPHPGASNHNIFLKRRYNYINTRYKLLSGKHH
jgi:hypothetical protein